jgi:pilus assembly protein CpaF
LSEERALVSVPDNERALALAAEVAERAEWVRKGYYDIVDKIRDRIPSNPNAQKVVNEFKLTRDVDLEALQRRALEDVVIPLMAEGNIHVRNKEESRIVFGILYDELLGISVLGTLWRDDDVDEILVDSWDKVVVERFGKLEDTSITFKDKNHAESVARHLSRMLSDRNVSDSNPLVTALLPGARVQFAWGNVSKNGVAISIRKFRKLLDMASLLRGDSLSEEMRDFLYDAVKARATILVSGGTGSGKTTMINALSEAIPDGERVITIEDAYELTLSNHHVVSLQAKFKSSGDDEVVINQEDLMVASLRMRPDRIIVGEIREPSAAAVMLTAANTGHDGTMTTLHASSADVALNNRLSSLLMRSSQGGYTYEVARTEIALAIDLVVHIDRRAGHRFISEIALVDTAYLGASSLRPFILFQGAVTISEDQGQGVVVRPNFRISGKVPLASKLGIKLSDLGGHGTRWLSTTT